MLFKQEHLNGIKDGVISLAFRKWKKLSVNQGNLINTSVGVIEVLDVTEIELASISEKDAIQAGFSNLKTLIAQLDSISIGTTYRIEVKYKSTDPRLELRAQVALPDVELQLLKGKLERLDQFSKQGNWTLDILKAIADHPRLKAGDLALIVGEEKEWLKINIRKLKNLGLTISHVPGYTLSPLGNYYLDEINKLKLPDPQ